jgi:hypothetical protein
MAAGLPTTSGNTPAAVVLCGCAVLTSAAAVGCLPVPRARVHGLWHCISQLMWLDAFIWLCGSCVSDLPVWFPERWTALCNHAVSGVIFVSLGWSGSVFCCDPWFLDE